MICIGIDPGTKTGFAVWDTADERFLAIGTESIHRAMEDVLIWKGISESLGQKIEVTFEDARQRTWYGEGDTYAKLQGAGSVKRDCSIWEDFLKDKGIPYKAVQPIKGATKVSPEWFKQISHWHVRVSQHARDAAMLVIGR